MLAALCGLLNQRQQRIIEFQNAAVYQNIREFTARVLVAASSLMPLLSVPEPIPV